MDTGSAAEYLCLPKLPTWGDFNDASQTNSQYLKGAEYEATSRSTNLFGKTLYNHNVPCAVCRSRRRVSAMMVPARQDCVPGWHREYFGYLMSGRYNQAAASQFVCVDREPESVPGSVSDQNGKLFYFVEGICGSLPCPPYENNREITCSVCTK